MTDTDLTSLIATANLRDTVDRAMLADALEDAGRVEEAELLREPDSLLETVDGEVVDVLADLPEFDDLYFYQHSTRRGWELTPVIMPHVHDDMSDDELDTTVEAAVNAGVHVVTPEEYIRQIVAAIPAKHIVFRYCPRGFDNEVSYYHAEKLPDNRGVDVLTRSELAAEILEGAVNAAQHNGGTSPPCGDYIVMSWDEAEKSRLWK